MTSEQGYKHEPLIKSPWRQVCGCLVFIMIYIVMMVYCTMHGYSFQLSFSFSSIIVVVYLIAIALVSFLPQSVLDRILDKWFNGKEYPSKREILTERAESEIPTDRAE